MVVVKKGIEQIPSVPTLSVFFGRGSGSVKTVIVQEDRTARPNGNIGSTMGTSVVVKLGSTPCCSCSVLCVCGTQLPTFVPRHRRGQRTLRHQSNLAHTIGLRRWILARTATTTSAWTPSPRNPTLTRGRQRWQQRRCLPSGPGALLHLCYCCLASGPDPPSPPHGTAWVLAAL